ncbi:MAG: rhamnulokinase, partial [Clostridiales bacterium]|nr:rhamnulokinase [Clostridiales bacterium]
AVPGPAPPCAQAAVPAAEPEFLFMSCGTWCLLGTELPEPVVRERARRMNLTNEAGFGGAYALMQNLTGLWLLQESRRQWRREGFSYTYDEIEQLAREAEPFRCFIEPGDGRFAAMGDLPGRVREFCTRSGQPVPDTVGAVARCLYESLALSFRRAKGQVEAAAGRRYDTLYLVGGGIQDALLCQMAADACGCRVVAGPKEATALGNAAIQLCALGVLDGLESVRETVRNSVKTKEYLPDSDGWAEAYARFEGLAGSNL